MLKKGDKAGIVCCSNGLSDRSRETMEYLKTILEQWGIIPVFSPYMYGKNSPFSGTRKERAGALMECYKDPKIKMIFDVSGGDMANEILPYLDFDVIGKNPKFFWGYSDLTVILNGIYAKTGQPSVLYQVRNLAGSCRQSQQKLFFDTVMCGKKDLFEFPLSFVQGTYMEGIVLGGNIRCFLKLAGTEFLPDLSGKLLFLESRGGHVPQMVTYLSQLNMMGVFRQIKGILLGTFSEMDQEKEVPDIISLVQSYAGGLPIARTWKVGHGADSMGIVIGGYGVYGAKSRPSLSRDHHG